MDFISHGLWGSIAFGRKTRREFLIAFLFGIMPDVLSFGIFSAANFLGISSGPDWGKGHPVASMIPGYVNSLYNLTHSFVIFGIIFFAVWLIRRKPYLPMLAWILHIVVDIPTHSYQFFPTPFLWPFSSFRFNGVSWGHPYIFFPDVILLILVYAWYYYHKKKKKV